jgi:late competence protein required for DNA uptake (superfamily II DNA/RNA helicase)
LFNKITILKALTGAGKTTAMIRTIKEQLAVNPEYRVLVLSCRKSFSYTVRADINKQLGRNIVMVYEDFEK